MAMYRDAMGCLHARRPGREPLPPDVDVAALDILDGDDDTIAGRPQPRTPPGAREVAYRGPTPDPGGTAGLWSAIEHL